MESDFLTEEDFLRVESMERRKMRPHLPSYKIFRGNISNHAIGFDRVDQSQHVHQSNVVDHKQQHNNLDIADVAVVNELKFNSIGQGSLATTGQTGSIFMPNSSLNQGSSVVQNTNQNGSLYETQGGFETSRDYQRTRDSYRFQTNFASPRNPRVIQTSRNGPFSNE